MKIKAQYNQHQVQDLNNNPLCSAIPVLSDKSSILAALKKLPSINTNFWTLPEVYQQTELLKLDYLHVPVPQLYALYNKFVSFIFHGYSLYSPMSAERRRFQLDIALTARNDEYFTGGGCGVRTTSNSVLVSGHSGTGKTTAIRAGLSLIPQVIEHEIFNGVSFKQDQLVWVSFDLPATSSSKALALNFFAAVDQALGTNYYNEWKDKSHRSVDRHLGQMQLIAINHHLGLVHIDEIQFMLEYKKQKDSPSFIVLEALFNKLGIPMILSCTSMGRESLLADSKRLDFTTARRLLNNREFKFSIFRISDRFFTEMFDALFAPELCTNNEIPGQRFKEKFYFLSCGLPAVMHRLAYLHHETVSQLRAKKPERADEYNTDDLVRLEKVFRNQFSLISNALKNLRAGIDSLFERQIEKDTQGNICLTNDEVQNRQENHRKKAVKNLPINNTTPLGIPEPQLSIDASSMDSYITGGSNE